VSSELPSVFILLIFCADFVSSSEFVSARGCMYMFALINPHQLFMGAVGLVFSPLAPLVSLVAAIVFWISSFVYKYQLMYVFVTRVESGGVSIVLKICWQLTYVVNLQRAWNVVLNRVFFSVLFMQVIMVFSMVHSTNPAYIY